MVSRRSLPGGGSRSGPLLPGAGEQPAPRPGNRGGRGSGVGGRGRTSLASRLLGGAAGGEEIAVDDDGEGPTSRELQTLPGAKISKSNALSIATYLDVEDQYDLRSWNFQGMTVKSLVDLVDTKVGGPLATWQQTYQATTEHISPMATGTAVKSCYA